MTIEDLHKRLNEIRMAAFQRNATAVDTLRQALYHDVLEHVAVAGDDDLRAMARAALMAGSFEVLG